MHCSKVAAVAVALGAPLVQAQAISLWNIPACAQSAATSGLASTGCDLTDIACVCSAVSFVTKLSSAVQQSCSIADQQATLTFAQGLCSKFGVTLNLPAIPAAAKAASSSAAAPAQAAASSAAAPSSAASGTPDQDDDLPATTPLAAAAASSSAEPIPTPPVPAASSTTAYRNSSATANSTVAASSPIPYVGAAIRDKVQGGMVLMVAAGVFWGL
ncbi:hypothetical protein XANCAGTX0491_000571 [Xanthoria calcicola]